MGSRGDKRETDCQEVEKPADRDHDEGMDSEGLGMACEKSRVGGDICSLYLLRSRMHDHNPAAVPRAFSTPRAPPYPAPLHSHLSVFLPPHVPSLISVCVVVPLPLYPPLPHPLSVMSQFALRRAAPILQDPAQVALACYTSPQYVKKIVEH